MVTTCSPAHLLTASTNLHPCSKTPLHPNFASVTRFKDCSGFSQKKISISNFKPCGIYQSSGPRILCLASTTAGESDENGKTKMDSIIDKAKHIWDNSARQLDIDSHSIIERTKTMWDKSPEPVKIFPWYRALDNLTQLIFDLIISVTKYLCVPVMAISSLSELSYCFHEKKQLFVPFPLLAGVAAAGVLNESATQLYPLKEDGKVPWHLISIALFFAMIKLPGPYYPYWGRILLPHFANGGLLRTLWFAFLWYRRTQKETEPNFVG